MEPNTVADLPTWVELAINLGVSASLVVYLVTVGMPNLVKEFREEMRLERESHEKEHAALRSLIDKLAERHTK